MRFGRPPGFGTSGNFWPTSGLCCNHLLNFWELLATLGPAFRKPTFGLFEGFGNPVKINFLAFGCFWPVLGNFWAIQLLAFGSLWPTRKMLTFGPQPTFGKDLEVPQILHNLSKTCLKSTSNFTKITQILQILAASCQKSKSYLPKVTQRLSPT